MFQACNDPMFNGSGSFLQGFRLQTNRRRFAMAEISFDESTLLDVSLNIEVDSNNNITSPSTSHTLKPILSSTPKKRQAKQLKCNECSYTTTSSGNLSRHRRSIHRKEKVSCTLCTKVFGETYDLRQDVRAEHDKVQLLCEIFNNRASLARHRRIHHSGRNKFICEHCGRQYYERDAYIGHINKHIGSRPFSCTTCKLSFRHKCNLNRHLKT